MTQMPIQLDYLIIYFYSLLSILIQKGTNMNKLVPMVLFYLEDGEKPRHKVTEKIKNYDKELRESAIAELVGGKLVRLIEHKSEVGRKPVTIELTEKGRELASELSKTPRHESVWGGVS